MSLFLFMSFTNIKKDFDPKQNFWDINPQLTMYKPFSKLYKRDKSKNKEQSSKEMWTIMFLSDPDDMVNKFARMPYNERLEMLKEEYYPEFDEEDEDIAECLEKYPMECLTAVERAFKEEVDSLVKRVKFIKNSEYTFDDVERDHNGNVIFISGKPMVRKGTATDLDRMRANTKKIYDQYEEVENAFIKERNEARVVGGRKESLSERGEI